MFAITHRTILVGIAVTIFVLCFTIIGFFGLRLGIDFTGGSLTEVTYNTAPEKMVIEAAVQELDLGGFTVRETATESGENAFLVRTRDLSEEERTSLEIAVTSIGTEGEVTRFTSIGPVIGQELRDKAVYAILGVVSIIVIYVAFAFAGIGTPVSSWMYGLVTILVLLHDVLVPIAAMSLLGHIAGVEVDILFVMAILAVLGYSVNDTIVIFDRVRENLKQNRTEARTKRTEPGGVVHETVTYTLTKPYAEIVGQAVSDSMARSINTSLTTVAALIALYLFGGSVTQLFALTLIIGVVAGTYSSIFIASPLVVVYADYLAKKSTQTKEVSNV